jgi:NAD(P)-dependent dehydrogenase (short-subunit alcohol dehydrogenase family)
MELSGATVLITGASRRIGVGLAQAFGAEGAKVIGAARSVDAVADVVAGHGGVAMSLDAASLAEVDGFIDRVEQEHGPIDVLINNAGIEVNSLFEDMNAAQLDQLFAVNLLAPIQLTHQMLPKMLARGKGSLVFTSSIAAAGGNPMLSTYAASKAGLTRFAESLRMELTHDDIDVTLLHLGPVDTEMWGRISDDEDSDILLSRGKRLHVLGIASVDGVANATVEAVRSGKREVRLPKRMAIAPALNVLGTLTNELVYRGIDIRGANGKRD